MVGLIAILAGAFLFSTYCPLVSVWLVSLGVVAWVAVSFSTHLYESNRRHILRLEREIEVLRASLTPPRKEPSPFKCYRCGQPQGEEPVFCESCGGCWEWCCTCSHVGRTRSNRHRDTADDHGRGESPRRAWD
jgi:hypothetical protein